MSKKTFTSQSLSANVFRKIAIILTCFFIAVKVSAQHDSLVLKNGDVIVGEIKSLNNGVVTIETDYSKSDFTIEWSGIKEIYSKSRFLITLTDGKRINGSLASSGDASKIIIESTEGERIETTRDEIVYLKGLKSDFWSRVNASIDLGLSVTKANNLRQFTVRSNVGYLADRWQLNFFYDDLRSKQDSIEQTRRTEFGPSFKYFLQNDWFLNTSVNFLANTEQAIKMRTTVKGGGGKYLVHTNKAYFATGAGLSYNNESFTNGTETRNSMEGYVGLELNLFDIEDLSLLSSLYVYPSFTESGRWRTDFSLDTKYDLPLDFYVKMGGTLNYDNRPAVAGNEVDFVFMFTVGWEL